MIQLCYMQIDDRDKARLFDKLFKSKSIVLMNNLTDRHIVDVFNDHISALKFNVFVDRDFIFAHEDCTNFNLKIPNDILSIQFCDVNDLLSNNQKDAVINKSGRCRCKKMKLKALVIEKMLEFSEAGFYVMHKGAVVMHAHESLEALMIKADLEGDAIL